MKKRIFSRALALLMALSLLSTTAFAASLQDLQDAINGTGGTAENPDYYGREDEATTGGIAAWNGDNGDRNVRLEEDVTYNDGNDAAPSEEAPAGDTVPADTTPAGEAPAEDITTVEVKQDQNVVLDLNGNSIEGDGKHDVINVEKDASLTVNGTEPENPGEPADTANTIIGDMSNDGKLTVNNATVDGGVKNSGTFNLNSSDVTGTVYNKTGAVFNKDENSTVGNTGTLGTYGKDGSGKYTLEDTAGGGKKLTIYPDSTGAFAGKQYESWLNNDNSLHCRQLKATQVF